MGEETRNRQEGGKEKREMREDQTEIEDFAHNDEVAVFIAVMVKGQRRHKICAITTNDVSVGITNYVTFAYKCGLLY